MAECTENYDDYAAQVAARVAEEEAEREANEAVAAGAGADPQGGESKKYDMEFIRQCFLNNRVGDSILYNSLNRGRYVYEVKNDRWYTFVGPHWDLGYKDRKALADVETVAGQYMQLLDEIEVALKKAGDDKEARKPSEAMKKKILSRLDLLRDAHGRRQVLECATSNYEPLTIDPEVLDQDEWLFAFNNCVVDLRTGYSRAGRPDDYITRHSTIDWHGIDEPCPEFDRFLWNCFDYPDPRDNAQRQEVIDYLMRVLGYAMTALNKERFFLVLYGEYGQNGKGTLMEILYFILGEYAGPIQTEMLMATRFAKGGSGPSPEILDLKGIRLAWASETEEGSSFANGKVKLFSGGDVMVGRGINARENTRFLPTHTLFLLCNTLPHAPAHDSAFWERIKVVTFPLSFVKRQQLYDADGQPVPLKLERHERLADRDLMDKLKAEAPGIAAKLVRGCLEYQRQGLNPPRKVLEDSLKYRRNEDDMQDFIDACCETGPEYEIKAKEVYDRYKSWWEEVSPNRPMSNKKFGELFSKKFEKRKSGGIIYLGVKLRLPGLEELGQEGA